MAVRETMVGRQWVEETRISIFANISTTGWRGEEGNVLPGFSSLVKAFPSSALVTFVMYE